MDRSLFIFRRDLRLFDNTGLNRALKESKEVIPIFILDPRQVEAHPYRSINGLEFMITSLVELDKELRARGGHLHLFSGEAEDVVRILLSKGEINGVYFNRDYTPFSKRRDERISDICKDYGVSFFDVEDALLCPPQMGVKKDKTPYTVFTPFFKQNSKQEVLRPKDTLNGVFGALKVEGQVTIDYLDKLLTSKNPKIFRSGGRAEGLEILQVCKRSLKNYNLERDFPARVSTSGLSPHHKFGTISVRESYWMARDNLPLDNRFISELYWRDFFTSIGYFFPHVFGGCFKRDLDRIEWSDNMEFFERWCDGLTGFPIVDAGMRELKATGNMHNRVRMIVASFLVKDLHIDWRWGERHFAKLLVDYDPAVNNGSWQWAASTGCDAQPYFRIFNPWLQQAKFDPECSYIKRWIPELEKFSVRDIHEWNEQSQTLFGGTDYPSPIVEHDRQKKIAIDMFKTV